MSLGTLSTDAFSTSTSTLAEKWYAVPMELAGEKQAPVVIFFDVTIIEAKNLLPQSFRMDLGKCHDTLSLVAPLHSQASW